MSVLPVYAALASELGDDLVHCKALRSPIGSLSHTGWQPSEGDYDALQDAGLILVVGPSFDSWIAHSSLPDSNVVRLDRALEGDEIYILKATPHRHGGGVAHTHQVLDPHAWNDPILLTRQAAVIRDALTDRLPDQAAAIQARFQRLRARLQAVHEQLEAIKWPANSALVCMHRSFDYLARRYGWNVINVIEQDGTVSKMSQKRLLGNYRAAVVIWASEDAKRSPSNVDTKDERSGPLQVVIPAASTDPALQLERMAKILEAASRS